ncbi:MAG: glycosyltransferase family 4 protein [Candidatus Acidiferrales bacterium]|jgi:spore coat protein SA
MVKVGYLNQPWDSSIPPNLGGSIPIWIWEVARCIASSSEVVVVGRRRVGETNRATREGVQYIRLLRIPSRADRWLSSPARLLYGLRNVRQPWFASSFYQLVFAERAARSFRDEACDLIHIHNFSQFVPIVRRLNPRAKIVLHMHCDWLTQLDHKMIDKRLRYADAIIGCSEYVTANIRARFPHYADRCMTIYNGVDSRHFHPNGRQSRESHSGRIVFVGRISPEKGLHILLDAFERVAALRPDASLEIIGPEAVAPLEYIVNLSDDPIVQGLRRFYEGNGYLDYLRRRVRGPLLGRVLFAGELPHSAVVERLRHADLCVVPSLGGESFGIPAVEAMATGLAVVASRVGGLTEIVEDGVTGLLTESENPAALAESLLRLIDDNTLAQKMGCAGRQRAQQIFSWRVISETLKTLYSKI